MGLSRAHEGGDQASSGAEDEGAKAGWCRDTAAPRPAMSRARAVQAEDSGCRRAGIKGFEWQAEDLGFTNGHVGSWEMPLSLVWGE